MRKLGRECGAGRLLAGHDRGPCSSLPRRPPCLCPSCLPSGTAPLLSNPAAAPPADTLIAPARTKCSSSASIRSIPARGDADPSNRHTTSSAAFSHSRKRPARAARRPPPRTKLIPRQTSEPRIPLVSALLDSTRRGSRGAAASPTPSRRGRRRRGGEAARWTTARRARRKRPTRPPPSARNGPTPTSASSRAPSPGRASPPSSPRPRPSRPSATTGGCRAPPSTRARGPRARRPRRPSATSGTASCCPR